MFDLHVHTAPDVIDRLADDADMVATYDEAGFTGCVLKNHNDPTAGRAALAGRGRRIRVYGGVALNSPVGGINPAAVAAALAMGARVVWLPTEDAHTQEAAGLPRLCRHDPRVPATTYAAPPVDQSTATDLRLIFQLVADADAVLATGHLSTAEIRWVVPEARAAGVRRLLLTHPSYTVPAMSAADAAAFAADGVHYEVTAYQLLHQPGWDAARLAAFIRQAGTDMLVLSSDTGQTNSPPPPAALHRLIDELAAQGLDRRALLAAASERPDTLVTP